MTKFFFSKWALSGKVQRRKDRLKKDGQSIEGQITDRGQVDQYWTEGQTSFSGIPSAEFVEDVDSYMKGEESAESKLKVSSIHPCRLLWKNNQ